MACAQAKLSYVIFDGALAVLRCEIIWASCVSYCDITRAHQSSISCLGLVMFSFWPLLIALIAAYGSMYLVDWYSLTPSSNSWTLIWIISLAGGLYLIAGGAEMATRWGNTISVDTITQLPNYAHTPQTMVAGLLLVFWPYTVMASGTLAALAALKCLRRQS
jgi:hypothetical protein